MAVEQAEVLEWSEAPPVRRGVRGSKYDGIIDELKANPGKQALVMTNVNSASAKVFRDAGLTVTTRSMGDGTKKVNVWAVYEPTEGEGDDAGEAPAPKAKKPAGKKKLASRPKAKS